MRWRHAVLEFVIKSRNSIRNMGNAGGGPLPCLNEDKGSTDGVVFRKQYDMQFSSPGKSYLIAGLVSICKVAKK